MFETVRTALRSVNVKLITTIQIEISLYTNEHNGQNETKCDTDALFSDGTLFENRWENKRGGAPLRFQYAQI